MGVNLKSFCKYCDVFFFLEVITPVHAYPGEIVPTVAAEEQYRKKHRRVGIFVFVHHKQNPPKTTKKTKIRKASGEEEGCFCREGEAAAMSSETAELL